MKLPRRAGTVGIGEAQATISQPSRRWPTRSPSATRAREAKAIHAKIDALNATQIALDKRENEVIANGNLSAFSRLQKREDKLEKRERNLNDKLNDVLGRLREPDYGSQKRGPTNFSGQINFDDLTKKERSLAERLIDRIVALNAKEVPIDERENRAIALGKTVNWFGKLERKEDPLERQERQLASRLADLAGDGDGDGDGDRRRRRGW